MADELTPTTDTPEAKKDKVEKKAADATGNVTPKPRASASPTSSKPAAPSSTPRPASSRPAGSSNGPRSAGTGSNGGPYDRFDRRHHASRARRVRVAQGLVQAGREAAHPAHGRTSERSASDDNRRARAVHRHRRWTAPRIRAKSPANARQSSNDRWRSPARRKPPSTGRQSSAGREPPARG